MTDHRTCDRCSSRYWLCELCCCSCDLLTCAPLGLSLGVPSPSLGDELRLLNWSSELYVMRWNYCYDIWNKHVLLWPRLPLQYVPSRTAVKEQDVIQFFLVIYQVCLFAVKSGCISKDMCSTKFCRFSRHFWR